MVLIWTFTIEFLVELHDIRIGCVSIVDIPSAIEAEDQSCFVLASSF